MKIIQATIKLCGLACVLLAATGCKSSDTEDVAATTKAMTDKRTTVEQDPHIPPAAKARILGGLPAPTNVPAQ